MTNAKPEKNTVHLEFFEGGFLRGGTTFDIAKNEGKVTMKCVAFPDIYRIFTFAESCAGMHKML